MTFNSKTSVTLDMLLKVSVRKTILHSFFLKFLPVQQCPDLIFSHFQHSLANKGQHFKHSLPIFSTLISYVPSFLMTGNLTSGATQVSASLSTTKWICIPAEEQSVNYGLWVNPDHHLFLQIKLSQNTARPTIYVFFMINFLYFL